MIYYICIYSNAHIHKVYQSMLCSLCIGAQFSVASVSHSYQCSCRHTVWYIFVFKCTNTQSISVMLCSLCIGARFSVVSVSHSYLLETMFMHMLVAEWESSSMRWRVFPHHICYMVVKEEVVGQCAQILCTLHMMCIHIYCWESSVDILSLDTGRVPDWKKICAKEHS